MRSARVSEPELEPDAIVELVSATSGVPVRLVRAAIDYWAAFPDEVDRWIDRAEGEAAEAEQRWHRERALLGQ